MNPLDDVRVLCDVQLDRLQRQLASASPRQTFTASADPTRQFYQHRVSTHTPRRRHGDRGQGGCIDCGQAVTLRRVRCAACLRHRAEQQRGRYRSTGRKPGPQVHGTVTAYTNGCRCLACGVCHAEWQRAYRLRRKEASGAIHAD